MHMSTAASVRLRSALWRRLAFRDVLVELRKTWMNGRNVEFGNVALVRSTAIRRNDA